MTIEQMKQQKKKLGYTSQEIADISGVPLGTVQKIFSGATKSPRYDTLQKLEQALRPRSGTSNPSALPVTDSVRAGRGSGRGSVKAHGSSGSFPPPKTGSYLAEPSPVYGSSAENLHVPTDEPGQYDPDFDVSRQGTFTYSDYLALPDDRRVELIDGWFYDMAAPNSRHQIIIGQFHILLHECAKDHPEYSVLLSPMDVMLDEDDRTVVQPDVMVLCDRSKMRKGRIYGAPDLVIEVASPGSRRNDYSRKATKYMLAGVREYWIVDYKRRKVVVFLNDQEDIDYEGTEFEVREKAPDITIYGADEKIPVSISEGKCSIDIGSIFAQLDALGDI